MKLERKIVWVVILAAAAVLGTGCGGLGGSYSVSPATFFLPGFLDAKPIQAPSEQLPAPPSKTAPSVEIFAKAK